MKKIIHLIVLLCLISCETVIYPDLDNPAEIIVVDAWLVQNQTIQEIRLTRSQAYFDDSDPQLIEGASVSVTNLNTGIIYDFQETESGYRWTSDTLFGIEGNEYLLNLEIDGETFQAHAHLGRVPEVDSVVFRYNPEDYNILESYYSAEFYASDFPGVGDAYWIKTWKNGWLLNKPSEINIGFDAGISMGQEVDGVVFHKSIRRDYLNPLEERTDRANYYYPPYDIGDSVFVEIHSIDPVAYQYLSAVRTQTDRPGGFSELFAVPLANVLTNLHPTDPTSRTAIAGFFNVAAVSSGGAQLTEELANKLQ